MSRTRECSDSYLPIYEVLGTGVEEAQARKLAEVLKIPPDKLNWRNGIASFIDPATYLAVPRVSVTDLQTVAAHRKTTKNHHPDIPIEISAIDLAALAKLSPLGRDDALKSFSRALESAGLTPEHATPIAGHTVFKVVTTESATAVERVTSTNLDTHITYRFTLDGYPLVGPGAQLQVSYAADGSVTRLHHAARRLKKGPAVKIVSADDIRRRFARFAPDDTDVDVRLVYWAPPLQYALNAHPCSATTIVPWYAVTIVRAATDPGSQVSRPRTSRVHLVPAIDDSRFVPTVTLTASTLDRSRVEARARASGGTPPYTYLWAGSNPEASISRGDRVSYTPLVRDFRAVVPTQSFDRIESLSVTVVDANGVTAQAGWSLPVTAHPAPRSHNSVTYGCESPNDPGPSPTDGSYAPERIAWQQAMGAAGQGGGSQRFCWLADSSWPGDFIEPTPPGSLEPDPWINGDADHSNWGINTANIVLYNGDGWANGFSEMYPGATLADYNATGGAFLSSPGSSPTVQIGSQGYAVNYNGAWGAPNANDNLQWLAMYACQILEDDDSAPTPWLRWGPAFNGLHSLLGFETEASDNGVGFMSDFPAAILGYIQLPLFGYIPVPPQTIVQGWLNTALSNNMGTPAAMGPIFNIDINGTTFSICDFYDYYWGKGAVGPNISQSQINGWWYIQGTDAMQDFP